MAQCSGVARGVLGAAGPGRHFADQKQFLKGFESSRFSLLFLNKFLKHLKVPSLFNFCV